MEFRKVKNSEGEILTTKEGVELEELRFEVGDEFVPLFNTVLERTHDATVNGQKRKITNYSIKCRARDKNKEIIKHKGEDEIFVALTPAQATSLKKKVEEAIELNQNLFVAYKYKSKDYGKQIGLGLKKAHKPAKTFEHFDNKDAEKGETQSSKGTTSTDNKDNKVKNTEKKEQTIEEPIQIEGIE